MQCIKESCPCLSWLSSGGLQQYIDYAVCSNACCTMEAINADFIQRYLLCTFSPMHKQLSGNTLAFKLKESRFESSSHHTYKMNFQINSNCLKLVFMMIFNLLCLLMNKFPVNMQIEYKQIIGIEDIGKFRILCDINVTKNEVNDFMCTHDFV